MRFVVPLMRSGLSLDLLKAFTRGPVAQHKYLRREPIFVKGKLTWRYWYANDDLRQKGMAEHDPNGEHEHHLLSDLAKLYEHFKAKVESTNVAGAAGIQSAFASDVTDPKVEHPPEVTFSPLYEATNHAPFVQDEATGAEPALSPSVRVFDALNMLPDYVMQWVMTDSKKGKRLRSFKLTRREDDHPLLGPFGKSGCGGYAYSKDGSLTLIAGGSGKYGETGDFGIARGDPATMGTPTELGDPRTMAEYITWHEFAHHYHYRLEDDEPALWEEWTAKYRGPTPKISGYAGTNEKEDFAETFACAISMPKLLAQRCPDRYEWIQKHVLTTLPTLAVMLSTPDEDLAWWNRRKETPPARLLTHLRANVPAPRFGAFYSPKDQFYAIGKGGRSIYMRFGPSDPTQEEWWTATPPTVDSVTGLPVYDAAFGPRFKVGGNVKELYDDKGVPLDDTQAFLYLGQDDPEVLALVERAKKEMLAEAPEGTPEPTPYEAYSWWAAKRDKDGKDNTHLLTYKMYTALGYKRASEKIAEKDAHTTAKERARVEKERKKGGTGYLDRHDWVPVEVTFTEYVQKSGTFKFGGIRPAEYQPWVARQYDHKTRTSKILTALDPTTGKFEPLRTATVYEQTNPDGTTLRLTVCESDPFAAGQTILAPAQVKTKEGKLATEWLPYKLSSEDGEISPASLARKFKVDVESLLRRNAKFARGQFTDPLFAQLINPSGEVIRDLFDIQRLMRLAASQPQPPSTWVSVPSKKGDAIVHFEVEFDGAGPPRVKGTYWNRKLGLPMSDRVRIDQIIDRMDEIVGVGGVKVNAPTRRKIKKHALVWVTATNHHGVAKRVMARFVERKDYTEKGKTKRAYVVQVLPGQGAGLPKGRMTTTRVSATDESELPGRPTVEKRFVEPLKRDVLLYADEVRRGSTDRSTSGVMKILAPSDGSISLAHLSTMPGVRMIGLPPRKRKRGVTVVGEMGPGIELVISPKDLPEFRAAIGGFVMEARAAAMMDEQQTLAREFTVRSTGAPWPAPEDLVDADGNINPEGVLKGMVSGPNGMQPGPHRIEALQRLAANGGRLYAAHFMGTGKTALAIAAAQMMRNLTVKDDPGKPHPNRVKKKVIYVVPPNVPNNWEDEILAFTGKPATLVGTGAVAGALRMFPPPAQGKSESQEAYIERALREWKGAVKHDPTIWNPWADENQGVVIGYEYFRDHNELMKATGLFDGMVVDEAHNIANDNEISRAVERWNPDMNMFLALSGTPITDTFSVLPRMVRLVTAGRVDLGSEEEFAERYLVGSAVMKKAGSKNPPLTDLNPQRVGELSALLYPLMHIATTQDVKGKTMPNVLLDENKPAHMIGQQARMHRLSMARFTPEEQKLMEQSGAIGSDETYALGADGRRKVNVARSISNCLAYKAPDQRETLTYESVVTTETKTGKISETRVTRQFILPSHAMMTTAKPEGWGGKWPTFKDVENGVVEQGYHTVLKEYYERLFGVTYESVEGKAIPKDLLDGVKRGDYFTPTGAPWGAVVNPDYGPEGMISRGVLGDDGKILPIVEETMVGGVKHTLEIPVGKRWIRDPNSKANGLFYAEEDWISTGRFNDTGESETGAETGDVDESGEPGAKKKAKKDTAGKQRPTDPALSVQRSTKRRKQRAEFDLAVTSGNAKTDELRAYMDNALRDDNLGPDQQFILFGNRVGSSFRVMEAQLRRSGFQDVNEALGNADASTAEDKALRPRKYFVTYAGKGATLGNRDLNSEIFRQKLDQFGHKTGQSIFVFRTMNGGTRAAPKVGEMREGWSRGQRSRIEGAFQDPTRKTKAGDPVGLEVPMRVTSVEVPGPDGETRVEQRFLYESEMKPKDKAEFSRLEKERRGGSPERKKEIDGELRALADRYWSSRSPLTEHYQYVLNNTQCMIATDAANVGLNWPAPKLIMYDSLFSPMDEWQRMTRAARMLDAAVTGPAKKYIAKIDAKLAAMEAETGLKEYGPENSLQAVEDAIESLDESDRHELLKMPGGRADQIVEAIFSKRAMDKIAALRPLIGTQLRQKGQVPDPDLPAQGDPTKPKYNWIPPEAIQESDVTNEILRNHVSAFEARILRARMYLIDVKRLTTSVNVPEMKEIVRTDPETGKKKRMMIPSGEWTVESPTMPERSQLMQGRAKMVPYEAGLRLFSTAQPHKTNYDYLATTARSLGDVSILPERIAAEAKARDARAAAKASGKKSGSRKSVPIPRTATAKKSEPYTRFFIPTRVLRGEA